MTLSLRAPLKRRIMLSVGGPGLLVLFITTNPGRVEANSLSRAAVTTLTASTASTWPGTIVETNDLDATTTTLSGPSTTLLQISVPGETAVARVPTTKKAKTAKKKSTTLPPTTLVAAGVVAAGSAEASTPTETKSAVGFDATITTIMPAGSVPDLFPDSVWLALRTCESHNNYAINTGNGYYGAYQFALGTWKKLGYSGSPHRAAPAVQDEAAKRLQAKSGWGQWPACTRKLGLR